MIIAITGLIGAGKSTVATRLVARHGFKRRPFATPLKEMARAFGLDDDEINGPLKAKPCDKLRGMTPRQFMQRLGMEFGRQMVAQDLWVHAWQRSVIAAGSFIVADDCRFPNEAAAVRALGGVVWRVVNPRLTARDPHESESGQNAILDNLTIVNAGDIAELHREVDHAVEETRSRIALGAAGAAHRPGASA